MSVMCETRDRDVIEYRTDCCDHGKSLLPTRAIANGAFIYVEPCLACAALYELSGLLGERFAEGGA